MRVPPAQSIAKYTIVHLNYRLTTLLETRFLMLKGAILTHPPKEL